VHTVKLEDKYFLKSCVVIRLYSSYFVFINSHFWICWCNDL